MNTEPNHSPKVFFSYCHTDASTMGFFATLLRDQGAICPWIETERLEPPAKYRPAILAAILESDVVALFLSTAYLASEFCLMEAYIARSMGKRVIPVMIEDGISFKNLTDYPETKGLEDLFALCCQVDGTSLRVMDLPLSLEAAMQRFISDVRKTPVPPLAGLAYVAYPSSETVFATNLTLQLRELGIGTWIMTLDVPFGAHWREFQVQALAKARALIMVMNEGLTRSRYVRTELLLAEARGIPVMPVMGEGLKGDDAAMRRMRSELGASPDHRILFDHNHFPAHGRWDTLADQLGKHLF